ncbi:MAG: carotenoid biosynthesis protein [Nitrospira sp.]|nr:carotenoid biosynthesis protein [Nitrospira sp.]
MAAPLLLYKTLLLRPYVFIFLAAAVFCAYRLIGWKRTGLFFGITWFVAFVCEWSSTRTGIPFGWYHYTGSTEGQELYFSNIPFMDSISFSFLLYASYCLALFFLLPKQTGAGARGCGPALDFTLTARTSWPACGVTVLLFALIDMVIDPVALRGSRWFLGQIYFYPDPGIHFGVPLANYVGWMVVGAISLALYVPLDRNLPGPLPCDGRPATSAILLGCGLYYGVLLFNLGVTFWIGEFLQGITGTLMYLPLTALFLIRALDRLPLPGHSD